MSCSKGCGHTPQCNGNQNNAANYVFIVLILYILLAIVVGGVLI